MFLNIPNPTSPQQVVQNLSTIEGPVDVYCWYEGPRGLPQKGAQSMMEQILQPLFREKADAKVCLYSLKAWAFTKKAKRMQPLELTEPINRINRAAVECLNSADFFRFCKQVNRRSPLYKFISEQLPKKQWLIELSKDEPLCGITVRALMRGEASLLDCIGELDAQNAYAQMQYLEGYYLIRESVRKGLEKVQRGSI